VSKIVFQKDSDKFGHVQDMRCYWFCDTPVGALRPEEHHSPYLGIHRPFLQSNVSSDMDTIQTGMHAAAKHSLPL